MEKSFVLNGVLAGGAKGALEDLGIIFERVRNGNSQGRFPDGTGLATFSKFPIDDGLCYELRIQGNGDFFRVVCEAADKIVNWQENVGE
ncbi:MAG: hypothetical protein COT89_01040 [Candidatus Colwellbacteria bacterium CG10_big_fil_rev_8_21_14_0_10_42_22]|uniref:Uncharacterized protein n=1 Tax=Candidatus Colwellbacteria bacterium CG10_big_fil_rev_8_21_14_0_10_42_22 TaxID=1974540 RepID=A0A2H0VGB0_9BACT|nr:MAG: hypothetical protein COT89_01040 [Candidatus Colwellbacteria bacterium CG10_big_fil_rev_8_21_14_0_10_42_22]